MPIQWPVLNHVRRQGYTVIRRELNDRAREIIDGMLEQGDIWPVARLDQPLSVQPINLDAASELFPWSDPVQMSSPAVPPPFDNGWYEFAIHDFGPVPLHIAVMLRKYSLQHVIDYRKRFSYVYEQDEETEEDIRRRLTIFDQFAATYFFGLPKDFHPTRRDPAMAVVATLLIHRENHGAALYEPYLNDENRRIWIKEITQFLRFSWALMTCKNVDVREIHPSTRSEKAKVDSSRVVYRELMVDGSHSGLGMNEESRDDKRGTALHIVRGHFKEYESHGLFGRYKGRWWWQPHIAGDKDFGTVVKSYKVLPEEQKKGVN